MEKVVEKNISLNSSLKNLSQINDKFCVSIIISFENTGNDKLQTVLKNEIKTASLLLKNKGVGEITINSLTNKLEDLTGDIKFNRNYKGVGIFVSESISDFIYFPLKVTDKTVVDESFEVRDIIANLNRLFRYNLIVLSKKKVRIFNGYANHLEPAAEVELSEDENDYWAEGKSKGFDPGKINTLEIKNHIHETDEIIRENTDAVFPFLLLGDVKVLSYFKKYSQYKNNIILSEDGNFDDWNTYQLQEQIKDKLELANKIWEDKLFGRIKNDLDSMHYVSGLQDIWTSIIMNTSRILIAEKDYKVKGWSIKNDLFLVYSKPDDHAKFHEDVIDDMAEMVIKKGGEVYFVQNDKLKEYGRILLIPR